MLLIDYVTKVWSDFKKIKIKSITFLPFWAVKSVSHLTSKNVKQAIYFSNSDVLLAMKTNHGISARHMTSLPKLINEVN